VETFVTVTVPLVFETTRTGTMTRPRVVVDTLAVDELAIAAVPVRRLPLATVAVTRLEAAVVVAGEVVAVTLRCGKLAATFGLGIATDDMVGVSVVRFAVVVELAIVVPAVLFAAWFGDGIAADDIVSVGGRPLEFVMFAIVVPATLLA
jgi:hypothetical protein